MTTMEQRERYEQLYHATTQYLLVRDFDAAEETVLSLLQARPPSEIKDDSLLYSSQRKWTGISNRLVSWIQVEEDRVKAYKLYTFVLASKWTGWLESNPSERDQEQTLQALFRKVVETFDQDLEVSSSQNGSSSSSPISLGQSKNSHLHPSILQTILLSLLKINLSQPIPSTAAHPSYPLILARDFFEIWLEGLSENDLDTISLRRVPSTTASNNLVSPRRHSSHSHRHASGHDTIQKCPPELAALNKNYRALLKIYILDILPRFEEWDLSREMILGGMIHRAEEQEKLLKKTASVGDQAQRGTRSTRTSKTPRIIHYPSSSLVICFILVKSGIKCR